MTTYAIITCAGIGRRMDAEVNKVFLLLEGEPIVARTLRIFQESEAVDQILLVAREQDIAEMKKLSAAYSKVKDVVLGGERRQHSIKNALISLDAKADDIVLVHNGVNPLVDGKTLQECVVAAQKHEAAIAAFPARDTLKEADEKGFVLGTIDRGKVWHAQTPQAFRYGTLSRAYKQAFDDEFFGTDDAMLVERMGKRVKIVPCSPENVKITLPNDLEFAARMISTSRIGFGMDSHRFLQEGEKKLMLAGVEAEGRGFDANSDGDVVLHALFNALSQALGERSLGHYADSMFEKGITDSKAYLRVMLNLMAERGYVLGNVGVMLEGRQPKILPLEERMKDSLSQLLSIGKENIGITATTGESLSPFGKGLGMQCFCVITLHKR